MPVFGYRIDRSRHVPKSGYPVCISVVFNPTGDFKPVAFGVEIDGMRYRYKIKDVKAAKDKHGLYSFDCEYLTWAGLRLLAWCTMLVSGRLGE